MHTIAICLCVYSLGSLHMSLVLSVDDLVVVRKWHILNRDACDAKIKLEKKNLIQISRFLNFYRKEKRIM